MKAITARHGRRYPDGSRDVVVRSGGRLVGRMRQLALPLSRSDRQTPRDDSLTKPTRRVA